MTHAQPGRPESVMNPVKLGAMAGAAVTSVGGVAVLIADGITGDELTPLGAAVSAAVTALAALGVYLSAIFAGRAAREQVTPLSDPRNDDGERLVPESQLIVLTSPNVPPAPRSGSASQHAAGTR